MNAQNILENAVELTKYLVFTKPGKTISDINKDFYQLTGSNIPFHSLGYSSLEQFMLSIRLNVNVKTKVVWPFTSTHLKSPYVQCEQCSKEIPQTLPWNPKIPNWNSINRSRLAFKSTSNSSNLTSITKSDSNKTIKTSLPRPNLDIVEDSDTISKNSDIQQSANTSKNLSERPSTHQKQPSSTNLNLKAGTSVTNLDKSSIVDFKPIVDNCRENLQKDTKLSPIKNVKKERTHPPLPYEQTTRLASIFNNQQRNAKDAARNQTEEDVPPEYSEYENESSVGTVGTIFTQRVVNNSDSESEDDKIFKPDGHNEGAVPYLAYNDPVILIGSKFSQSNFGEKFITARIESKMEIGKFYEVYISEVNSPFRFWFQFNDSMYFELHDRLNECYTQCSTNCYKIDKRHMVKGYPCAALYYNKWHRAEFTRKPLDNSEAVELFFVDYGTVDEIPINDIRYLLNSYCEIPKLCYRGSLDFIKPKNQRWSNDECLLFLNLIEDVKLNAGVTEIDTKNNSAKLYVIDCESTDNSQYINCQLVLNGHAFPSDPREKISPHFADIVPTFEALECGEFPSLHKSILLLNDGYDINIELGNNVIQDVDCYLPLHASIDEHEELKKKTLIDMENAKKMAEKNDITIFLKLFGSILQNPFINGMISSIND